jgi:prepilin-type processing-associated H-X9-DG protein
VPFAFNNELHQWNQWKNVSQLGNTAGIVYMTYGFGFFNQSHAQEYVPRPTDGAKPSNNIYYLEEKQAMVGFLDGHVEKLSPPIPQRRFKRGG